MTEKQIHILRHALGWPKNYRNHFVTDEGTDDYPICEELTRNGMMRRDSREWVPGYIYIVTEQGKRALREMEGEK